MPLTLGEFLLLHLLATAVMAALVFGMWRLGRWVGQSPSRWLSSSIAAPLHTGGFFAGGFVYWLVTPAADYQTVLLFACYGSLAGVSSGHLIGWIIWKYYRREVERNEDT